MYLPADRRLGRSRSSALVSGSQLHGPTVCPSARWPVANELSGLGGAWRMRPPVRSAALPHCWAAAVSSWSQVTRHITRMTTSAVIGLIRGRYPTLVHSSGALIGEPGLRALRDTLGLKLEKTVNQPMDLDFLGPKLRKSYVLVVFKIDPSDTFWHTVLVYGVDRLSLCYMDPLLGRRRCQRWWDFALGSSVVYVLWRD